MYAINDAASSKRAAYANTPDWPEMVVWRRILHPGDLFVDVGANVGLYTIWALDCGADVVAVEPNPECVRQLRRNLDLNGYTAEIVTAALSDAPGRAVLAGPDLNQQRLLFDDDRSVSDIARVDVLTLDSVLGDRKAAWVKVDVEGAEKLVLEGAPGTVCGAHQPHATRMESNVTGPARRGSRSRRGTASCLRLSDVHARRCREAQGNYIARIRCRYLCRHGERCDRIRDHVTPSSADVPEGAGGTPRRWPLLRGWDSNPQPTD